MSKETQQPGAGVRSVILGVGGYLPARRVLNDDLARLVDTTDEWIQQRTGICSRHIADDGETTSQLGAKAARAALENAGVDAQTIDLIIVATSTPDYTFPSVATQIQAALEIYHGAAFDMQAVCSGFVFALSTADKFLRSGSHKRALVIGAETFSRILDWSDRTTCVLFGDGAGAMVLEAQPADASDRGILASRLRSDGRYRDKLYVDGGPSSTKTVGHLRMAGKEVFRHAVNGVGDVIAGCFEDVGLTAKDIDWFAPHQANERIIASCADKFGIPLEKTILTVSQHGNTSAASIPLALTVGVADGRIKKNDLILIEAVGGGFTWGAALMRW